MNIEKLFQNLNRHRELIFYLFEHRDRIVSINEIEEYCSETTLEILDNFEIIELGSERVFLDARVINFLEEYIDGSDTIEVSAIAEKIKNIEHNLSIAREHKEKQRVLLPKIRRELKKIDAVLFHTLDKLRIHIDRIYKSADSFALKLKELYYYKEHLQEYEDMLGNFERFLKKQREAMHSFYDSELNALLLLLQENKIALQRSLIPLTQDVIEYINQAQKQNIFIEKIIKLKELKDNFELKTKTDIALKSEHFDLMVSSLRVGSRLDREILHERSFASLLHKISSKAKIKSHKADPIAFSKSTTQESFLNVAEIHFAFSSSQLSLMEFLLHYNKLKDKEIQELGAIYCKMILLYEEEYRIESDFFRYKNHKFAKVYYDNRFR